jgi:hypothetical protein
LPDGWYNDDETCDATDDYFYALMDTEGLHGGFAWILTTPPNWEDGYWFEAGAMIDIFASPNPGYNFSHWIIENYVTGQYVKNTNWITSIPVLNHLIIRAYFEAHDGHPYITWFN